MKLIIVLALIWDATGLGLDNATGLGLDNAPFLLAAFIPIKIDSNAEADKAQILKDKKK